MKRTPDVAVISLPPTYILYVSINTTVQDNAMYDQVTILIPKHTLYLVFVLIKEWIFE